MFNKLSSLCFFHYSYSVGNQDSVPRLEQMPSVLKAPLLLIYFSPTFLRHSPIRVVNSPNKYFTKDHKN